MQVIMMLRWNYFVIFSLDDHSRVVLDKIEEDVDSDYINASYIDVSFHLLFRNIDFYFVTM